MAGPTRYCPACYRPNVWDADHCFACDATLETDESFEERLIWALDHPDSRVSMFAAGVLAERRVPEAIDRLIELVGAPDPYRAAAAALALVAFKDDDRARAAVRSCRDHPSALVRRAVADTGGPTSLFDDGLSRPVGHHGA